MCIVCIAAYVMKAKKSIKAPEYQLENILVPRCHDNHKITPTSKKPHRPRTEESA